MPRLTSILCSFAFLFQSTAALAWGDLGHETVAMIAQARMTPQAMAWVESILGAEPLSVAAIWPDQVRDDDRYKDFANYHLCDVTKGANGDFVLSSDPHNCLAVFQRAPAILNDKKVPRAVKMIVLRYLIHVTGDSHQPLHVGNGLDLGANLCTVKVQKKKIPEKLEPNESKDDFFMSVNLHGYWDSNVVDGVNSRLKVASKGWFGSRQLAAAIIEEKTRELSADEINRIAASNPKQWIAESAKLRRTQVYPDAADYSADERKRPYCKYIEKDARGVGISHDEAFQESAVPYLTFEAQKENQALAELQLFKGGVRLAAMLNTWAPKNLETTAEEVLGETLRQMMKPATPVALPPQ